MKILTRRVLHIIIIILLSFLLIYQYSIIQNQKKQVGELKKTIVNYKKQEYEAQKTLADIQEVQADQNSKIKDLQEEYKKLKQKRFLTQDDVGVLERIVEAEASNQGLRGKLMVSSVIQNRLIKGNYKSIKEVVFAKGQFSPVTDGSYYKVKVSEETKKAVDMSLEKDYSNGSLYFLNPKTSNRGNLRWFNTLTPTASHADHVFYK